jgi:hypothetical protein
MVADWRVSIDILFHTTARNNLWVNYRHPAKWGEQEASVPCRTIYNPYIYLYILPFATVDNVLVDSGSSDRPYTWTFLRSLALTSKNNEQDSKLNIRFKLLLHVSTMRHLLQGVSNQRSASSNISI